MSSVETACSFGETRGGEIEQRQGNEEQKIVHACVQARNQTSGREQFVVGSSCITDKFSAESVGVPVLFHNFGQPHHAQQRKRKARGKQRVHEARRGWQQSPSFPCYHATSESE